MTLLLSQTDVDVIVSRSKPRLYSELIARVRAGYEELGAGTAELHPRIYLRSRSDPQRRPPGLFSMSALLGAEGRMGTRLLALGGSGHGGDALIILFDLRSMRCLAIINDQAVHNMRSGTPAGLATALLARKDARTIGVVGSSGIAAGGLLMSFHARPAVESVRVFSPTQEHRERFATTMSAELGIPVVAVSSADEAVRDADIIVTATDADRPVVPDGAVAPGTHCNCLSRNELEPTTYARSRIFVSSSEVHKAHDPPFSPPLPEAAVFGDLIDLAAQTVPGRLEESDITVYAASGPLATWDVATASVIYENATALGVGTEISLW
jgi:alanine dehydrogenase